MEIKYNKYLILIVVLVLGSFWFFSKKDIIIRDRMSNNDGLNYLSANKKYIDKYIDSFGTDVFGSYFASGFLQGYSSAIKGHTYKADYEPIEDDLGGGFAFGYTGGWLRGCLEIKKYNCGEAEKSISSAKEVIDLNKYILISNDILNSSLAEDNFNLALGILEETIKVQRESLR